MIRTAFLAAGLLAMGSAAGAGALGIDALILVEALSLVARRRRRNA